MSSISPTAMLVADTASAARVLPVLRQQRPDLHWEVRLDLEQATFELCSGRFEMAVIDGEQAGPRPQPMLATVRRCVPAMPLVVYAADLAHPTLRLLSGCRWLMRLRTDALAQAVA